MSKRMLSRARREPPLASTIPKRLSPMVCLTCDRVPVEGANPAVTTESLRTVSASPWAFAVSTDPDLGSRTRPDSAPALHEHKFHEQRRLIGAPPRGGPTTQRTRGELTLWDVRWRCAQRSFPGLQDNPGADLSPGSDALSPACDHLGAGSPQNIVHSGQDPATRRL